MIKTICVILLCGFASHANADERGIRYVLDNFRVGTALEELREKYPSLQVDNDDHEFVGRIRFRDKIEFNKMRVIVMGRSDKPPLTIEYINIQALLPVEWTKDEIVSMFKRLLGEPSEQLYVESGDDFVLSVSSYLWGHGCEFYDGFLPISGVVKSASFGIPRLAQDRYALNFEIQNAKFRNSIYELSSTEEEAQQIFELRCANSKRRREKSGEGKTQAR